MKESLKAALWSIFIFPGGGHFYLKKWLPGGVLAGFAVAALTVILMKVVERANQIAGQIILGEIPFDLMVITEMVSKQSKLDDSTLLTTAWYVLIAIWVLAAIDAYRLGNRIDREVPRAE